MNHVLTETYNIDTEIQQLQTKLYENLVGVWNTSSIDAYGRVYKNERSGKTIPEVYDATLRNYKDVFYNGQSCFFFVDNDNHSTDEEHEFTAKVKICFMLKLDDLKTASERVDADVKRDVVSIIRDHGHSFTITGYLKTIDTVFREFDTASIKHNDMQPLHVFAIEGNLNYVINDKCN